MCTIYVDKYKNCLVLSKKTNLMLIFPIDKLDS
jgi:hypothetical protein